MHTRTLGILVVFSTLAGGSAACGGTVVFEEGSSDDGDGDGSGGAIPGTTTGSNVTTTGSNVTTGSGTSPAGGSTGATSPVGSSSTGTGVPDDTRVEDLCALACDCNGCTDGELVMCIDDGSRNEQAAETRGCGVQFDALFDCGLAGLECIDGRVRLGDCDQETRAFDDCMAQ